MTAPDEKDKAVVEDTKVFKPVLNMDPGAANDAEVDHDMDLEKPNHDMTDDQYPHGIKLVILAGASIIAVFLIALDQVSSKSAPCYAQRQSLTQSHLRLSSAQQSLKSLTNFTASKMYPGMLPPTS